MNFEEIRRREAERFLPGIPRLPVAIVSGQGARVRDVAGREFVDLTAGWGVLALGHSHPSLVEAIRSQAGRLMQTTNLFYTLPQLDLCDALAEIAPAALTRSFFVSSGSEAVEGAVKLAHRASGRRKFVSATGGFHGRTLGALQLVGQAKHRDPYRALLPEPVLVPYGDADAAAAAVDGDTAALIVEPLQGEGGVNPPPPGYLQRLRQLTQDAGALLILDEVQTGIGRTGRMLALEHEGVIPDVLVLGKGLGGGFPIAAFMFSEAVAETVAPGDHGGTYAGNPLACAAACATLRAVQEEKLPARAARLGESLLTMLGEFAAAHPRAAGPPRGRGLLIGLPLGDGQAAQTLAQRAIEAGVLVNITTGPTPAGGTVPVMRLFPPLNIPEDELFGAVEKLLQLLRD